MRQFIEPFVTRTIASTRADEDMVYYYDEQGQVVADVYHHDGQFCAATFYGQGTLQHVTNEQAVAIAERVKHVFQHAHLQLQSVVQDEEGYDIEYRRIEPVYGLLVEGVGLFVTVTHTGFVQHVTLHEDDVTVIYPQQMISPQQARAILQQETLVQLGIIRNNGWQYAYVPNYDVYGVEPDGRVQRWSDEEMVQQASFEPLPNVAPIAHFEAFIRGGRAGELTCSDVDDEKRWVFETDDSRCVAGDSFTRACQVVQHLVGDAYVHYHFEQIEALHELLQIEDERFVTYRFVYIYEGIAFDFEAIAISVDTKTQQIHTIDYPIIPFAQLQTLQKPTLTLAQANDIVTQLVDVQLSLQKELTDPTKRTFCYNKHYPTSPTGAHIESVDAFSGDVRWIDNTR